MFEETLARLRTHHKNVQRYRQLLETSLTDFEREYIGKRLSEEKAAIEVLSADVPTVAPSGSAAQIPNGNPPAPLSAVTAERAIQQMKFGDFSRTSSPRSSRSSEMQTEW
jgi:hypothetical protein